MPIMLVKNVLFIYKELFINYLAHFGEHAVCVCGTSVWGDPGYMQNVFIIPRAWIVSMQNGGHQNSCCYIE